MTAQGNVFEARLDASVDRENPFQDVQVDVTFTAPSGRTRTVAAFWDGGRVFRARIAPDEPGGWSWRSQASDAADAGLHARSGNFHVSDDIASHPVARHGPLRVSASRTHLEHADGTPFFWLGDTAWNGCLRASAADWDEYLAHRARQGFTTVQVVLTQWLAAGGDADSRTAWLGRERIAIDPWFFQRLDERMAAIARHGLVAVPIVVWAATWNPLALDLNPGTYLPDDQVVRLCRYIVARYGAQPCVWMLAGDGDYRGEHAPRWHAIGRAVFPGPDRSLVTMHPGGQHWLGPDFRREPWYDFIGYQGCHWDDDEHLRWLVEGPPAQDWRTEPRKPIINLEPNYEAHRSMTTGVPFDARDVRRAAWWSLLVSPPAGLTYGVHGVWSWETRHVVPMAHVSSGVAPTWREAMHLPGSTSMQHLAAFFRGFDWWNLRPAPELCAEQPGRTRPRHFIAVASSEDRSTAVAYLPEGGTITFAPDALPSGGAARWFDPATGAFSATIPVATAMTAPAAEDFVLLLRR